MSKIILTTTSPSIGNGMDSIHGNAMPMFDGKTTSAGACGKETHLIGVLKGEGVGPEVIDVCLALLDTVSRIYKLKFDVRFGGAIGLESHKISGRNLTNEVVKFCKGIFGQGGTILAGPGGGRFVYEMRRKFDLFAKVNPLVPLPELEDAAPVNFRSPFRSDILVVRDNRGGLYQGRSRRQENWDDCQVSHRFSHSEKEVAQLVTYAAQIAAHRRGILTVVTKESGLPELSDLWFRCAQTASAANGVELRRMDVDFAVYQLIARPGDFDVIAVSNCFGDILSDLGGVLMGSRGVTYGASYSQDGCGVYQTNHGAAYDLAGKNCANPAGQIFSLAMLLAESFGLRTEAAAIVQAVLQSWRDGWRTADVMAPGKSLLGTAEIGRVIAENIEKLSHEGWN